MENMKISKRYNKDEARDLIKRHLKVEADPDYLFEQLGKKALPQLLDSIDEKFGKPLTGKYQKQFTQAMIVARREDHVLLSATVKQFSSMTIDFARELEKEFKCETPSEKALIDLIAGAYGQWFELSNNLTAYHGEGIELTDGKTKYYAYITKERDRAFNQYMKGLAMLKYLKSGTGAINFNTFLAHNQQFNTLGQVNAHATREEKLEKV